MEPQQPHNNFWKTLPTPFFALAPMADVTDQAFRRIVTKYGKPDVLWTEFVSADGLQLGGYEALKKDLEYTEAERPIVAQLFGSNTETMRQSAKLCAELGFDGIDINMGCPDKSIEKQGAGAATIKTPDVAVQIIQAVKDGIRDAGKTIPVSVKTRIGYSKNEIATWIPLLLAQDIDALTVHARTRKELSLVPARWEHVREVVEIRNKMGKATRIIGNGDIRDMEDGYARAKASGADGVMVGRAIFGNPWLFAKDHHRTKKENRVMKWWYQLLQQLGFKNRYWLRTTGVIKKEEKLRVLVEHAELFEKLLGATKSFSIMKKHFKAYVNGFAGAKELRVKLMEEGDTARKVRTVIENYLTHK
jgi:nifR3 family TIM-barrel protein